YRASNIDKTKMEGSGMGLAIVKEIIDRHKGTIEATSPSKIGNVEYPGTTVTIRLPYKIAAEIEPEEISREDY
ncbi:MAG: cell wall metabolism sensor histidine kinase WalK, partial [Bacteroidetes bacterium]|nr:cell wall metabolism sensor histidine kinase WalK [Bacteroidota bacterium]